MSWGKLFSVLGIVALISTGCSSVKEMASQEAAAVKNNARARAKSRVNSKIDQATGGVKGKINSKSIFE